jgi:hypothetical protein
MRINKNLSDLADELTRAREDLRIIEEQLLFQTDVVEEAKTRMLVSETPVADQEFRIARDDLDRLQKQRTRLISEVDEMRREQDRLLDRMLGSRA